MKNVTSTLGTHYSAGTIDESMLSDDEKRMVEQFASEIDIENVNQVVNYGINTRQIYQNFRQQF